MVTFAIPCPRCGRVVDVVAHDVGGERRVMLPTHETPDGSTCSKDFQTIPPRIIPDPSPAYMDAERIRVKTQPREKSGHPPAPWSEAPILERLRSYALACPFSTLLKLFLDVQEAHLSLSVLSSIFYPTRTNDGSEADAFDARLDDIEGILGSALECRLREGLKGFELAESELALSFVDGVSNELVEIPLGSLLVRHNYHMRFARGSLPDDPESEES